MVDKSILVVEDEGIVALDIQMHLEDMGYSVCEVVATGSDAIDIALNQNPDLILMDINLKGAMSGIQAAEEISAVKDIPIIYLTANTDNSTLTQATATAPYGYIMKPFNQQALYATIESALHRHSDEKKLIHASQAHYERIIQSYQRELSAFRALDGGASKAPEAETSNPQEVMPASYMSQQLQGALERDELEIHYQPLVKSQTREIIGVEALLRWQHPQWGRVMPSDFIPVAIRNEMIIPITNWLLMQVCEQQRRWAQAGYDLFVSINVTAVQFETPDFVALVRNALRTTQIGAKWLKLEITENIALDTRANNHYLAQLREMGVAIAIDDFGKGYSSLDYLQREYISVIKIDKLLTQGINSDPILDARSKAIITAINELAHTLDIMVVVEGVETEKQYQFIRDIGCDVIQGYLFGKPMPAAQLAQLLQNQA